MVIRGLGSQRPLGTDLKTGPAIDTAFSNAGLSIGDRNHGQRADFLAKFTTFALFQVD
jgi:hypothetical protein